MTVPLTEALLGLIAAILLWTVTELWKLSKVVAGMQAHSEDTNRRLERLEDRTAV